MRDLLYNAFLPLGASLDLEQLHAVGTGLGRLMWTMLRQRRRETIQTIAARLDLPVHQAAKLGAASFEHTARSFLEIFYNRRMDQRFLHERVEFENLACMQAVARTTRPAVIVGAHLGCWELMVGLFALVSSQPSCQVVVRLPKDKALGALIRHMRSQPGLPILPHRDAATKTLPHLRQGGMAAFLVDHNCRQREAEFFPFLGQMAAVNKGPALLALRAKALVWPIFLLRLPAGRVRVYNFEPLDTATLTGSRQERMRTICQFYTTAVEQMVRAYPEQWFWMHRRWKTQPESCQK